ncbi:response regulator [Paenibacillus gansuensis]|uniref:Response regulator n=1 Tax=Paenibacillus gansuensis TaxID=306542 RepID=A0ABW5PLL5_9BACL
MYRILIADDEKLVLETLRDNVDWKSMDIEIGALAKNGKEALQLAEQHPPDLILTDVKMPIMDGLDFAAEARRLYPKVKIIFLSGYDEFVYIKKALALQAADYLLKPIDFEEVHRVLQAAVRSCDIDLHARQDTELRKGKLWKELLTGKDLEVHSRIVQELQQLGLPGSPERMRAASLLLHQPERHHQAAVALEGWPIMKAYSIQTVELKEGEFALIAFGERAAFEEHDFLAELNAMLEQKVQTMAAIGTGLKTCRMADLPSQYGLSRQFAEHRFYAGADALITPRDIHLPASADASVSLEGITTRLSEAVRQGNAALSSELLSDHFNVLKELVMEKHWVCSHAYQLILGVYGDLFSSDAEMPVLLGSRTTLWGLISACTTADELRQLLEERLDRMIRRCSSQEQDRYAQVVEQVKRIVESSLHAPLTLHDLSQQVYLSPNYLRSIFKERTGMTLHDYITDTKLRKATELLKDKSLKIHEISNRIGYENVSYFCSIFQKYKGTTPNEYRKKLL